MGATTCAESGQIMKSSVFYGKDLGLYSMGKEKS